MPVIGGIVAGVVDAVTAGAAAVGSAVAGVGAALAPEAAAAGAADVGAGVAAADVGAGVAAADVGVGAGVAGATALPEILVTPGVAGAEAAGAGALTGGALTGAEAAGAGLLGGAPIAGAAGAEAAGLGLAGAGAGGVTSIPEVFGGATAPLAALSPSDVVGQDFGALTAAGIGPSVDLTAPTLSAGDTAPLLNVGGGGGGGVATDAFASGSPDTVSQDFATIAQPISTGGLTPGDVGQAAYGWQPGETASSALALAAPDVAATAPPGIPTPTPAPGQPVTDIAPTIGPGTEPGAPLNLATAAPADIGSTIGPGAPVSPAASSLFSGSTLRTLGLLAPAAALGLTLARGPPSLPPAMQQALNNLGPTQNLANQQLQEGATGHLTPGQVAQVNQYKQNATNQLYQLFASMGRNPQGDTDFIQGTATINANAIAMQQQFIDSAIKNGLAAQGVVDAELNAAATMQAANDTAFSNSLQSAMNAFGLSAALSAASMKT